VSRIHDEGEFACRVYSQHTQISSHPLCFKTKIRQEFNAFPESFNQNEDYKKALEDTLELYFSICSILNTNHGMSTMAATLANGGLNPFTGKRMASPQHVRNVLPLMLSCGMYDYSGQWSFGETNIGSNK